MHRVKDFKYKRVVTVFALWNDYFGDRQWIEGAENGVYLGSSTVGS